LRISPILRFIDREVEEVGEKLRWYDFGVFSLGFGPGGKTYIKKESA
jgi:hypothetical protein